MSSFLNNIAVVLVMGAILLLYHRLLYGVWIWQDQDKDSQ